MKKEARFFRFAAWSLCSLAVLFASAGCAILRPAPEGDGDGLSLTLVQAGNVVSFVPPQIFVSRAGCHNLLPPPSDGSGPAWGEYTAGLAVLVAENRGGTPLAIPWWSYRNWDIVLEPENGEPKFFALHNDWRVDGPGPVDGYVHTMELAPGGKAAFVVGVDDCGPRDAMWGKCPYPPCMMYVEYRDGKKTVRSNGLPVRWQDVPHPDILPNGFRPLEIPDDAEEGKAEEMEVEVF